MKTETMSLASSVMVVSDEKTNWDVVKHMVEVRKLEGKDDPFYIVNLSTVLSQYRKWASLLPRIQPHYAIKSNPDPSIIRLLALLGCGFDCASKGEIDLILSQGINADRIIFANTIKPASSIKYAAARGVDLMTFDNEGELEKIKANYPDARLVLRISVFDHTAISKLSLKFGCEPVVKAPQLMHMAAEMGLNVVGISFHVGGGSKNPNAYAEGIANARRLFNLGKELGFKDMHLLDIGGGYPGFCSPVISLVRIAEVINRALDTHFADLPGVRVISEPGRFFAMPSSTLTLSVIAKTSVPAQFINENPYDASNGFLYYVNDGVFGSFNCVPVYKIEPPAVALNKNYSAVHWSRIWGPTCDSADCIAPKVQLPELEVGDWLVYEYMGAYTRCIASDFNGISAPGVYYMITESDSFVRSLVPCETQDILSKPKVSISRCSSAELDSGHNSEMDSLSIRSSSSFVDAVVDELATTPDEERKPICVM